MECKTVGHNSNSVLQKQQTYHQKHQLQQQDPVAHVSILQLPHQQNSLFKSENATHKREQLKSQHQSQQMKNQKQFSKINREIESLLTFPG